MLGIWDCFRFDFGGCLEDFGGDVCRMFGGVLICCSYSFGCFWEDSRLVLVGFFIYVLKVGFVR